VPDGRLREQLRLAKFNSSICCGVLDEFLAARLLSQAGQLLASRGELMARARTTVGDWIGKQDAACSGCRPRRGRSAVCGSIRTGSGAGRAALSRPAGRAADGGRPGPVVRDSVHVMRLGLAYPPSGELGKGLEVIADALDS